MSKTHVVIVGLGVALVCAIGVIGIAMLGNNNDTQSTNATSEKAGSLITASVLDSLDKESSSLVSTSHLADGLTPPTNKWYSSMVLNKEAMPGFSVPNSILPTSNGFELGLPSVTTSSDGVYGPHVRGIHVAATDAVAYKLTRYDELTMTLTYYDSSDDPLLDVTFASGSPYGFISAKQKVEITIDGGTRLNELRGVTTFKNGDAWYGAKASNGKTGTTIPLNKHDELAVFSASKQADLATLAPAAQYPIVSGKVDYVLKDSKIQTILSYQTKGNAGQTILIRMPHQIGSVGRPALTYPSLYGTLEGYESSRIEYTQPLQKLKWSFDLAELSEKEEATLTSQLDKDIENTQLDKDDTYFGGKQLQRLAQLVMVADSLDETGLRDKALAKLTPAMTAWFDSDDSKSFYFDETAKTIVGRKPSFGSDKELNDHHFHYGYFIYAASVVAKFDEAFLSEYKAKVSLLVADIANYRTGEALPLRRSFDAYAGHSWASGIANYGDGNNQESSSEAVNAWTGVGLWAEVNGNDALKSESSWLLANEVATAKAYWLSQPKDTTYTSPLVAINWGGKREYKTFFSDEPNAKLAIQLLPLNPTMKSYVAGLPKSILRDTDTMKPYGDYILMAKANKSLFEEVQAYPSALIDDGNSKSYMMAYVISK